jgi:hypothetical protein
MPRDSRLGRAARARVILYLHRALRAFEQGANELPPMDPTVRESFLSVLSDQGLKPETGDDAPFTWSR